MSHPHRDSWRALLPKAPYDYAQRNISPLGLGPARDLYRPQSGSYTLQKRSLEALHKGLLCKPIADPAHEKRFSHAKRQNHTEHSDLSEKLDIYSSARATSRTKIDPLRVNQKGRVSRRQNSRAGILVSATTDRFLPLRCTSPARLSGGEHGAIKRVASNSFDRAHI